ncbi:type 1 fimbrial protein [Avibacterium paragallinarum]|uniref:fimbrial protein n=2 Tax=Avibacterium paragallinarum TaxID=728 RepID=UPI0021F6C4CC|nr:fimbrial protein [Avibacterium paragallinarum]UXN35668.1 type 1 fimbrial protein [Avibacterium paragallinarum]
MKKLKLVTLIASSLAFASNMAFAETNNGGAVGTVTINGEVVDATCTVEGTSGADVTVTLPKVSKSLLASQGQTAGDTTFTIKLKDCSPNTGTVRTYFYNNETNVSTNGRLINQDSSGSKAGNVTIQLANLDGSAIDITKDVSGQGVTEDSISGGKATLSYLARYYAEGQSTAGKVKGVVKYMIAYQ